MSQCQQLITIKVWCHHHCRHLLLGPKTRYQAGIRGIAAPQSHFSSRYFGAAVAITKNYGGFFCNQFSAAVYAPCHRSPCFGVEFSHLLWVVVHPEEGEGLQTHQFKCHLVCHHSEVQVGTATRVGQVLEEHMVGNT